MCICNLLPTFIGLHNETLNQVLTNSLQRYLLGGVSIEESEDEDEIKKALLEK